MKKYDNYKDSGIEWIGEIPEHWKISRIKFYLDYQKGKNPKELKFIETEETEVYLAMDYLRGNPKQMLYVEDVENYVKVDDNEILLLWDGSNAGEFVLSKKGILSSTMAVLNLKNIQKNFSWYYFKHFEPQLKESTIGMGVPHVNGEELKNGLIAIPTPEEQTAIANYLDRKTTEIDELIADKKRLLELYEEEKTAIINQAVTKGINPNVPMKDSGIEWLGEIPEHWEVKRLKYVANSYPSNVDKKSKEGEKEVLLCNYVDVYKNDFITSEIQFMKATASDSQIEKFKLKKGDVIATKDSESPYDIAIPALVREVFENVICGYHLNFIRPIDILGDFLFRFFQSEYTKGYFFNAANGVTRYGIGTEKFSNFVVCVPPIEEQKALVNHIETECALLDAKTENTKKLIDLLTEYRTALISEVVTGKIKVIP